MISEDLMSRLARSVAIVLLVSSNPSARQSRNPGMGATVPAPRPSDGTGTLQGDVTDDAGSPIRNVTVSIWSQDAQVRRSASTDEAGTFAFADLPAALYSGGIEKAGYLSAGLRQRSPFTVAGTVSVTTGTESVHVTLWRGATIRGQVFDEHRAPLAGVQIAALQHLASRGDQRNIVSSIARTITDDKGSFRISNLRPGVYYVLAVPRLMVTVGPNMQRAGLGTVGYAQALYPGATDLAGAQAIPLTFGEASDISFSLSKSPMRIVSGMATDSAGRPLIDGSLMVGAVAAAVIGPGTGAIAVPVRADGSFVTPALPEGAYRITARAHTEPPESGSTLVHFAGADLTDVSVVTKPPVNVYGRLVPSSPLPATARLQVSPVGEVPPGILAGVGTDLTFSLRLPQVPIRFSVLGLPAGWMVESVRSMAPDGANGIDVAALRNGQVEILVTNITSHVDGVVSDASRADASGIPVLVSPTNAAQRSQFGRIKYQHTDGSGHFSFQSLPEGDYSIIAFDDADPSAVAADANYLAIALRQAHTFTIKSNERKTLSTIPIARLMK